MYNCLQFQIDKMCYPKMNHGLRGKYKNTLVKLVPAIFWQKDECTTIRLNFKCLNTINIKFKSYLLSGNR